VAARQQCDQQLPRHLVHADDHAADLGADLLAEGFALLGKLDGRP
jgi:hypothetical protein